MTSTEFILLATAVGTAIKASDWLAVPIKAWWAKRQSDKQTLTQTQLDQRKLDQLAAVDVSQMARSDFKEVKDTLFEMTRQAIEQKNIAEQRAEEERKMRLKNEDELKLEIKNLDKRIETMEESEEASLLLRQQLESEIRIICDTLRIAYWTIGLDGKVKGNITFFELTGLKQDQCHNDGWFIAVEEAEREYFQSIWNNFTNSFDTRPKFKCTFKHLTSGKSTPTEVFCGARTFDGFKILEFTARTTPLSH